MSSKNNSKDFSLFFYCIIFFLLQRISPSACKYTIISSTCKSTLSDCPCPSSWHSISLLVFIEIVIKKVAASLSLSMLPRTHSKHVLAPHSTDTDHFKVINDFHVAKSHGQFSALILLDRLAAFDRVGRSIFLEMFFWLGFQGPVLSWFSSYHTGCLFSIFFVGFSSFPPTSRWTSQVSDHALLFSILSVLTPLVFSPSHSLNGLNSHVITYSAQISSKL